jgi:hypothetical protein
VTRYVTATLGEPGFSRFLREVYRAGVLSRDELLGWIALHGAVLRMEPALQDGDHFDEEAFAALERELGG